MDGRIYECKKELELPKWDEDDDSFTNAMITVEKGSLWERAGSGYMCDGEIRLEEVDNTSWIEISKETLKECFDDVTDDDKEMENEYYRSGY